MMRSVDDNGLVVHADDVPPMLVSSDELMLIDGEG